MKRSAFTIAAISFIFCSAGLIILLSASATYSNTKFESLFFLFNSQVPKVVFGILFLIGFSFIPYEMYKRVSKVLIVIAVLLLFYTLWQSKVFKGSTRWINLGIFTFQPVEVARLFLIIHLAVFIERKGELIQELKKGFLYSFIWIGLVSGLIFFQPNVSNALIIIFISLAILFVGGAKFKHIFVSVAGSFLVLLHIALFFSHARHRLEDYVKSVFGGKPLNEQVTQALYALGSGGIFGQGLGNSKQSNLFLPESYGDFIFAIIGEEFGFVGTVVILLGYFLIFFFGLVIAKKARDTFGQLLAFGVSFSILINAFINIAVTAGMFPTTGIPLPFISYGGTSIIITCVSVGILMNIAIMNAQYIKHPLELNNNYAKEQI